MESTSEDRELDPETESEFRSIIEGSGAQIIEPKKYSLPESYDIDKFPEQDKPVLKLAINSFQKYLDLKIISDNFQNHKERRVWRGDTFNSIKDKGGKDGLDKAYQFDNYLKANKMKRNKIAQIYGICDMLNDVGAIPDSLANRLLAEIGDTLPKEDGKDPWEGPTTPEKIKKVEEISDSVAAVLNYLGKKD